MSYDSAVRSTSSPSKGAGFDSQHLHGKLSATPVLGDRTPSSDLQRQQASTWYTNKTCKPKPHTRKMKTNSNFFFFTVFQSCPFVKLLCKAWSSVQSGPGQEYRAGNRRPWENQRETLRWEVSAYSRKCLPACQRKATSPQMGTPDRPVSSPLPAKPRSSMHNRS